MIMKPRFWLLDLKLSMKNATCSVYAVYVTKNTKYIIIRLIAKLLTKISRLKIGKACAKCGNLDHVGDKCIFRY